MELSCFVVADTGIGIPAAHLETVFQEFTQVENPLQERYRGTGLGLPLVRKLAMLLGGKVWLESEVGRGSRFYAEIPLLYKGEADVSAIREEMPAPEFSRSAVLLIVHDPADFLHPGTCSSETQSFSLFTLRAWNALKPGWTSHAKPLVVTWGLEDARWDFLRFFRSAKEALRAVPSSPLLRMKIHPKRLRWARLWPSANLWVGPVLRDLRRITRQEQPGKLLLVDDNELSLYILRELLDRPWLNLLEAHNGQEALEMVNAKAGRCDS